MMNTRLSKLTIISAFYITLIISSNLMATKLTSVWGFVLPAAVLIYPLTFMLGDVLADVWGYGIAKKVIWLGFIANALVVITTATGIYMPYPTFWGGQEHYSFIFGLVPRIVIGSFLGYLAGEMSNAYVLGRIKRYTGERLLFVRTIGSSVVGQVLDTCLFIGIAFYGTMPLAALVTMMITQYIVKLGCESLVGTPLAYLLVKWARR